VNTLYYVQPLGTYFLLVLIEGCALSNLIIINYKPRIIDDLVVPETPALACRYSILSLFFWKS